MFCFTLGSDWEIQHLRLIFEVGALLEDPAIYPFSHPVDWFIKVICSYWRLHCIWDILMHFILNSDVYSSFMNYYSLSIPLHCITLCKWSMIDLFTVYFKFCQILLTIRYFELFKSDMYGFIVEFEWSKIAGRYITTQEP